MKQFIKRFLPIYYIVTLSISVVLWFLAICISDNAISNGCFVAYSITFVGYMIVKILDVIYDITE